MRADQPPTGLGPGSHSLWLSVTTTHAFDPAQRVLLQEACRAKDRLDRLDQVLRGESEIWLRLTEGIGVDVVVRVDAALSEARRTANLMKQVLAAMRLPDQFGKRPQYRGARGAYMPAGGSSLDRFRDRTSLS